MNERELLQIARRALALGADTLTVNRIIERESKGKYGNVYALALMVEPDAGTSGSEPIQGGDPKEGSFLGDVGRAFGQGAAMQWGDDLIGKVKGSDARDEFMANLKAGKQRHPIATTLAGLAGTVAGPLAAGAAATALLPASIPTVAALTTGQLALRGAAAGGAIGAIEGSGMAEEGAKVGGGLFGGAVGAAAGAIAGPAARVGRRMFGNAGRRTIEKLEDLTGLTRPEGAAPKAIEMGRNAYGRASSRVRDQLASLPSAIDRRGYRWGMLDEIFTNLENGNHQAISELRKFAESPDGRRALRELWPGAESWRAFHRILRTEESARKAAIAIKALTTSGIGLVGLREIFKRMD